MKRNDLIILIGIIIVFVMGISTGCGAQSSITSPPSTDTSAPEETVSQVDETAEPTDEGDAEQLIITPTLAPTSTPGVLTEIVDQVVTAAGVDQVEVLGIKVDDWINLLVSIIIVLFSAIILSRIAYFALRKAVAKTSKPYDDLLVRNIRPQITWLFTLLALQFGTLRLEFLDPFTKQWMNHLYLSGIVIITSIITWKSVSIALDWYKETLEPKHDEHQSETILILFERAIRVTILLVSGAIIATIFGININAFVAALGIGGLALSLAAQDTLANMISGVIILMDQPFRVGDRIQIQGLGTWGDVVDIGLRTTRIRTRDNRLVIVPNAKISSDQVINYSYPDPRYRIEMEIGVGYGQDIESVRRTIVNAVSKVEGVLEDKPVEALYVEMGDSAMIFRIRWWIESYIDTRRMFDRVNTTLQNALDAARSVTPPTTYDVRIIKEQEEDQKQKPQLY